MSEEKQIEEIHKEISEQVAKAIEGREKLFQNPEQRGFIANVNKVKIIDEQARKLFSDLAADLEKNGLLSDVLIDDDGYIHDGLKRVRLLGLDQIKALGKLKTVPKDSKCENIPLSKNARKQHLKWSYEYMSQNETWKNRSSELIDMLAKRYGIGRATVYRWLEPEVYGSEKISLTSAKPKHSKCDSCPYKNAAKEEFNIDFNTAVDVVLEMLDTEDKPMLSDAVITKLKTIKIFIEKWLYAPPSPYIINHTNIVSPSP
jgi:hypothetical protein